jgi:hypothetical protein
MAAGTFVVGIPKPISLKIEWWAIVPPDRASTVDFSRAACESAGGYAGVRVIGDTAWLHEKEWKGFCEYEDSLHQALSDYSREQFIRLRILAFQ